MAVVLGSGSSPSNVSGGGFGSRVGRSFLAALRRSTGESSADWTIRFGHNCNDYFTGIPLSRFSLDVAQVSPDGSLFHCGVDFILESGLQSGSVEPVEYDLMVMPNGRWKADEDLLPTGSNVLDPCSGVGCSGLGPTPRLPGHLSGHG
jgi:hypothetical protein